MKIRSITYFLNPGWPVNEESIHAAGMFIAEARTAFETSGYEVQTTRLACTPFPRLLPSIEPDQAVEWALTMEAMAISHGFEYLSLGPAMIDSPASYSVIPSILGATQNTFLAGMLVTPGESLSLQAMRLSAEIIQKAATITKDGFTNLRFAALANVPPGAPFFPAAYHSDGKASFALATEAADLAVEAFSDVQTIDGARQALISAIEGHARELTIVSRKLSGKHGISFGGIDFTLAPFPQETKSIGKALESLGVPALGLHGSLAAAAIITDTLERAVFPRAGFNGLFMPALEDAILARRAAEQSLTLKDLLLYSAVCGTGLDTLPLPGDTDPEQIYAILLDLAALSLRLDKPLTARLMPIPGKKAGDAIHFDFPYFADSRVLSVEAQPLFGLLGLDETVRLGAYLR